MTNEREQKANEIGKQATELSRKIEKHQVAYTNDAGKWVSKKAERQCEAMQRELDRLDAELDRYCEDGR